MSLGTVGIFSAEAAFPHGSLSFVHSGSLVVEVSEADWSQGALGACCKLGFSAALTGSDLELASAKVTAEDGGGFPVHRCVSLK